MAHRDRSIPIERQYLEGQGDLVSVLISLIDHIVSLTIPMINLLTKCP